MIKEKKFTVHFEKVLANSSIAAMLTSLITTMKSLWAPPIKMIMDSIKWSIHFVNFEDFCASVITALIFHSSVVFVVATKEETQSITIASIGAYISSFLFVILQSYFYVLSFIPLGQITPSGIVEDR